MPIGVSCPDNVMALDVDDCPTSYYTPTSLQEDYYDFMTNYLSWLKDYNAKSTFFTAFSYSGNAASFWDNPQSLQAATDIVESGNELGLHCGDLHLPLDEEYWGSTTAVTAEVNATNEAVQILKQGLLSQHGLNIGNITSYVAPGNCMTAEAYQALRQNTTIKYVGEGFGITSQAGTVTSSSVVKGASAQETAGSTITDALNTHNQSASNANEAQVIAAITARHLPTSFRAQIGSTGNVAADASAQYTLTVNIVSGSPVSAGTVTETPSQATYAAGSVVQLTAVPAAGWIFVNWSGSNDLGSTTTKPTTVTMNGNGDHNTAVNLSGN